MTLEIGSSYNLTTSFPPIRKTWYCLTPQCYTSHSLKKKKSAQYKLTYNIIKFKGT